MIKSDLEEEEKEEKREVNNYWQLILEDVDRNEDYRPYSDEDGEA